MLLLLLPLCGLGEIFQQDMGVKGAPCANASWTLGHFPEWQRGLGEDHSLSRDDPPTMIRFYWGMNKGNEAQNQGGIQG